VTLVVAVSLLGIGIAAAEPSLPFRQIGHGQIKFRGKGPEAWYGQYRKAHKERLALRVRVKKLRRAVVHQPSSLEALRLSSIAYGVPYSQMLSVALCETGGSLNPRSKNSSSSASGLLQFLTSTFANTPYAREDIFSPYANALAAGWLWRSDGGSWREWSCQP